METLRLDAIRECFDSAIPALMATAAPDGTPNVAYLSQVQYVDGDHLALSYQFFNKTRKNILANPQAQLLVVHPLTARRYRLRLQFLRTETAGPLFEVMRAKLSGIASQTGMTGVFRLLGADVFRVLEVHAEAGESLPAPPKRNHLAALRACSEGLQRAADLEQLLCGVLGCLEKHFDIRHAMVLMVDPAGAKLYTVATRGYETSGVGSEIPMGQGVIGVAARERTPIRIGHMSSEVAYSRAIRDRVRESGGAGALEVEIPLPGLEASRSQLAVPILAWQDLLGVLYVESPQDLRFSYDDEDALVALAAQLGLAMRSLQGVEAVEDVPTAAPEAAAPAGPPLVVRHYAENDSVFFGSDYVIKGVAGSILWTLLRDHVEKQRSAFTNRELRLDARIRLPDLSDNLEARLLLLSRRLAERDAAVRIEKTGRGRFQLRVARPIQLLETDAA